MTDHYKKVVAFKIIFVSLFYLQCFNNQILIGSKIYKN